jgi:hypothetical protein
MASSNQESQYKKLHSKAIFETKTVYKCNLILKNYFPLSDFKMSAMKMAKIIQELLRKRAYTVIYFSPCITIYSFEYVISERWTAEARKANKKKCISLEAAQASHALLSVINRTIQLT